jgi:hypothetical protein
VRGIRSSEGDDRAEIEEVSVVYAASFDFETSQTPKNGQSRSSSSSETNSNEISFDRRVGSNSTPS